MRRKLADRRGRPRFEIVGDLWGTLDTAVAMLLRDIGRGGALVQSALPLPERSVHNVAVSGGGAQTPASVRVQHVRPALAEDGRPCFLIGLEFLSVPPGLSAQIERWLAAGPGTDRDRTTGITERRKYRRVEVADDETVRVELRHRVQLLDISVTGALIACEAKLPLGTRGQFTAGLADTPFTAQLVVGRHHPREVQHGQIGLGASFGTVDEQSREHLEQFLRRGSE